MKKLVQKSYIIIMLFILGGCTLFETNSRPNVKEFLIKDINLSENNADDRYLSTSEEDINQDMDISDNLYINSNESREEVVFLPNSSLLKNKNYHTSSVSAKKLFDNKKVKITIESMPLNKFISLIFSKILQVDFVVDPAISNNNKPISLNLKNEITKSELFDMVLNILDGVKIAVNIEKNIFYIKASKSRTVTAHGIYVGDTLPQNVNDNSIVYFMKPYYYNNELFKHTNLVREYFLSKTGTVEISRTEKLIKIRDKAKNIRKAISFYNFLDKPSMHNKNIKLIYMKHMDADKFIKQVTNIVEGYGIDVIDNLSKTGLKFIPISQLNAFLLISDKEEWADTVMFWKKKLDIPKVKNTSEVSFFVYKPLNRKAEELVEILKKFLKPKQEESTSINSLDSVDENASQIISEIKDNTLVVVDKERNNIIIQSTSKKYHEIEKILHELDTLPKQVLIEVTIAEITLKDSLEFGLEWYLKNNGSDYGFSLNALNSGGAGIVGNLFSLSGKFGTVFNALQEKKYLNILSNPKLLVLNNHSANINIGNQVPTVTSQASVGDLGTSQGASSSILQNITYISTGITLAVTPVINSQGYLTLNISQTVSDAQTNNTSDISSPLIFNRSLQTDVILKSGESVMLGGLITENKSNSKTKIPFLGDIPIVKNLFSTTSDGVLKTELVILVKPTIINNSYDSKKVTEALLELVNFE